MSREEAIANAKKRLAIKQAKERLAGKAETPIVDEMHPDISFATRFGYKNFAADPEAGFNYLQKKHPELNFKKEGDRVLAKRPEEAQWRVLDPSGFDMQDITDVAWDVPAGAVETAASAVGGIGGGTLGLGGGPAAPVTVPAGALAGAAAAGGATGAGLESLRQGIGNLAGITEGLDTDRVKSAAKWGMASPLLFGTGATGKQALKAVGKEASKKLLAGQSGLIGKSLKGAKNKVSPWLGQMASGIDKDTLKYARNNLDRIEAAEQSTTGGAEIYGELRERIEDSLQRNLDETGEKLGKALDADGIAVDVVQVEAPMREMLAKYEAKAMKSIDKHGDNAMNKKPMQDFLYLQEKLNPYLEGQGTLKGYDVKDYLDNLNEITQIAKNPNLATKPKVDKELIAMSRKAASNLDKQASQGGAGQAYKQIKGEYAQLKNIENNVVNKWFKDDMATERTLNNLLSRKNKARKLDISKAMDKLDVPLEDTARESIANTLFMDPSMDVLSTMGTTSTSRSVPLGGFGGLLGYYGGSQIGGGHGGGAVGAGVLGYLGSKVGSPYSMRKFMEMDRAVGAGGEALRDASLLGVDLRLPQSGINVYQQMLENQR